MPAGSQNSPQNLIDKIPPEVRETFMLAMQLGTSPNPLLQHVNSGHIKQLLDNAERADSRQAYAHKEELKDRKHTRLTTWAGIILVLALTGTVWAGCPPKNLHR